MTYFYPPIRGELAYTKEVCVPKATPSAPHSDVAEWRNVALQAIRAADLLAEATIDRLDAGNEYRINEALEVLYGIPGYWQLSKRAAA